MPALHAVGSGSTSALKQVEGIAKEKMPDLNAASVVEGVRPGRRDYGRGYSNRCRGCLLRWSSCPRTARERSLLRQTSSGHKLALVPRPPQMLSRRSTSLAEIRCSG